MVITKVKKICTPTDLKNDKKYGKKLPKAHRISGAFTN